MSTKKSIIPGTVKRELVRTLLERSQNKKMAMMTSGLKGAEEVQYEDVEQRLNIPYINRDEVPLAMDVFKPVVPKEQDLPVIVTIHGGGLVIGDRSLSRNFSRLLAHKGYLVFSIEYRLAPKANVCEELDDVCAGLDLVGRMLVDYNVDFTRIFMAADSAGAYLAAYVAAMNDSSRLQEAIGYEPTRLSFKALGLCCGMFYTNRNDPCGWMLSEQLYGEKRTDDNFLQYMNPEHPEIINNLPPVFFTTSRGDFINNYSFMMNEAMRKAGKVSHLVYYPDPDLWHAFFTMQTHHPSTIDAIDKMLAWFEEQAALEVERRKKSPEDAERRRQVNARLDDGSINAQPVWQYIQERRSAFPNSLHSTALISGDSEYTYEQMFREWERYARVFSALGMTGANRSRVAIIGAITAEPLFSFYGLNMTGAEVSMFSYPDLLPGGRWKTMVKTEKITDLLIADIMVQSALWEEIREVQKSMGIRNVILLHSRMGGPCVGPAELTFNEFNYHALRRLEGTVFMGDLLQEHESAPIVYGEASVDQIALITHTSGTTRGTRKPLPYTNRSINTAASNFRNGFHNPAFGTDAFKQFRIAPSFDFSSFLSIIGNTNSFFATGDTVVLTFFGFLHPKFVRAAGYYNLTVMVAPGFLIDKWMEREDDQDMDFSSLKVIACAGSYMSPENLKKYSEFLSAHGFRYSLTYGYGMSETGGAEILKPEDCDRDILGFPSPKENFRVLDENDQQFYTVDDGVRTGTMYLASDSLCQNELDGETLFEYTQIDGRDFICTNDMVRVNEDGSLSYAGRADRYFVNNEGIRFDPGLVEVQIAAQPGIRQCAVVPVLDKRIHDTVPVLYVVPEKDSMNSMTSGSNSYVFKGAEDGRAEGDQIDACGEAAAVETVRKALVNVFIHGDALAKTNLPSQFVLVNEIPVNTNAKPDIYRITRERLQGTAYNIVPVRGGDNRSKGTNVDNGDSTENNAGDSTENSTRHSNRLLDIQAEPAGELNSLVAGALPEGMGTGSALNVFDLFNSSPEKSQTEAPAAPSSFTPWAMPWFGPMFPPVVPPTFLPVFPPTFLPAFPSAFNPTSPPAFNPMSPFQGWENDGNQGDGSKHGKTGNRNAEKTNQMPESVMNAALDLMGRLYGQKKYDHYFES
ncbi:MAG: AMP-binding protein [Eubacteriales bacterium]|nr:AMP-binding protein [Eubacteriales bacterium]